MRVQTYIDQLGAYPDDALLVCFGTPPSPPPGNVLVLTDFGPQDLAKVQALRPEHMKKGLVFFIDSATYAAHRAEVDHFQRHLAWIFCKFVTYTSLSGIPDPCGLHGPRPLNVGNEINRSRNMPWLLRSPLVDSLGRARIGLPVLLILPGPSLASLGPRLAELSRSCLVVCLARTLDFCLQRGVEPDFLLQLDTAWRQAHFLPEFSTLPGCTLVALSLAPVDQLAGRCRGVFFMDSFDMEVLPNPNRLRESWLSSLLPCLGLAEALAAPLVLVAGADLSYKDKARYHGQEAATDDDAPPFPAGKPLRVNSGSFHLPDVNGRQVTTVLPYFATSYEASVFAQQIRETTGTRFHNLSGTGILDPGFFPPADENELAALPAIDRSAFRAAVDRALGEAPDVQLIKLKVKQLRSIETVRETLAMFHVFRWKGQEEAADDPLVSGLPQSCDFLSGAGGMDLKDRLALTLGLLETWERSLAQARAACLLELERSREGRVPVLCLPGEDPVEEAVRRHPGIRPEPVRLWLDTTPPPEGGGYVVYTKFPRWLREQKVCLVTAGASARWGDLLEVLPWDNRLLL